MKITRKKPKISLSPREQLTYQHRCATRLHKLFPQVERLRIELIFDDANGRLPTPSPQLHTLYAAAPAFFRFSCPCADCDGDFDLTEAVTNLVSDIAAHPRHAAPGGILFCRGARFRHHAVHHVGCSMQVRFQLHSDLRLTA
jgi:hypothetical protein